MQLYPLPGVLVTTLSFDEKRVAVPKRVMPFRKGEKRWTKKRKKRKKRKRNEKKKERKKKRKERKERKERK